jgi:hypothetical protein
MFVQIQNQIAPVFTSNKLRNSHLKLLLRNAHIKCEFLLISRVIEFGIDLIFGIGSCFSSLITIVLLYGNVNKYYCPQISMCSSPRK